MNKHLIVTVHGIRTYGNWARRLEELVHEVEPSAKFIHYTYGYFSLVAFLIPPLRWIATRRFAKTLNTSMQSQQWERIDIVAHSFGSHMAAWALRGLSSKGMPAIDTLILAGSILRPRFRWDALIPRHVRRLVNDCGVRDTALIASQVAVLFTGMAGRVGFSGGLSTNFLNRYFNFGHSGFFEGDEFMQANWVPLLTTNENEVPLIDQRPPLTPLRGVAETILNNAEPIKLSAYFGLLLSILFYQLGLLLQSEASRDSLQAEVRRTNELLSLSREQLAAALIGVGTSKLDELPHEAVRYAEAATRLATDMAPASLLQAAIRRYPKFAELRPHGANPKYKPFIPDGANEADLFAVDQSGRLVLGIGSVVDNHRATELVLRNVETGKEVDKRSLEEDEALMTPEPAAVRLIVLRKGKEPKQSFSFRVFDLKSQNLQKPVTELNGFRALQSTSGAWPLYGLKEDGHIYRFDVTGDTSPIQPGTRFMDAERLSVHPAGSALAVFGPSSITIVSLNHAQPNIVLTAPSKEELYRLYWGPRWDTFLLYSGKWSSERRMWASANGGALAEIWTAKDTSSLWSARPARARNGSRFLVTDSQQNGSRPIVKVLDIDWPDSSKEPVLRNSHELEGAIPGTSILEPKALAIREDGLVAVVAHAVTGISGTQLSTSKIELWNLAPLDSRSTLMPTSIELMSGPTPISRIGMSENGQRLFLWDEGQITHVFRIDGEVQRQVFSPKVEHLKGGRVVHVNYGALRKTYDLKTGETQEFELDRYHTVATHPSSSGAGLYVTTDRGFTVIEDGGDPRIIGFGEKVEAVVATGDLWLIALESGAVLVDPHTPTVVGFLDESRELDHLASLAVEERIFATHLQDDGGGRYSFCGRTAKHDIGCWVLRRDKSENYQIEQTVFESPEVPKGGRRLFTRANRPGTLDVIFILDRYRDQAANWLPPRFRAFSVSTGAQNQAYNFPAINDSDFRGIVWSHVSPERLVVIGRFSGPSTSFYYAVCTLPILGGTCDKWIPISSDWTKVLYSFETKDKKVVIAFSTFDRKATLIAEDGRSLWSGELLTDDILPGFDISNAPLLASPQTEIWRDVSRDVALGGTPQIFSMTTKLIAPDLNSKLIEQLVSAEASYLPSFDRWSLLEKWLLDLVSADAQKTTLTNRSK